MPITQATKSLAQRLGAYNAVRYSKAYYWIMKFKNPAYIKALKDDLDFYRATLGNSVGLVFDVGANHGDKTWAFRQLAQKVVSIEPDKTCFAALRSRYARDRGVALENVALGDRTGDATFFVEEKGSAYNTLSEKERDWLLATHKQEIRAESVSLTTLDRMIAKYGVPDYLKIDVEGCELPVLNGLTSVVPVMSFEANLPRFREETLSILERFADDRSLRFNLRLDNAFVFSAHQLLEEIIRILNRGDEVSYEIFVFNPQS